MKSFLILFLLSNLFCFGETESEFTSLFDGKTLKGWLASPGGKWEVKDGVLLGTSQKTDKRHGILFSEKEYSDFILRAKFRVLLGNSGFYFRAENRNTPIRAYGFQAEMTYRAIRHSARVVEIPITFRERVAGESKMSHRIVLEAMALEVPVLSTKVAGVPTLIKDRENGLLVDTGSMEALLNGLREVLKDEVVRSRYAAAGRRTIEDSFSFALRMQRVKQVYDKVLARDTAQG